MAKNDTKAPVDTQEVKKTSSPTYTVAEFTAAPKTLGVNSPDIVKAALSKAGKTSYTVEEAKKLVNEFKNKEVK